MFCTRCGKENAAQANFCFACGSPLTAPVAVSSDAPMNATPEAGGSQAQRENQIATSTATGGMTAEDRRAAAEHYRRTGERPILPAPPQGPSLSARGEGLPSVTFAEASAVARLYRRLVFLVAAQFLVGTLINVSAGSDAPPVVGLTFVAALLAVFGGLLVTSFRLNRRLGSRAMLRAFGMCVPLVNLFVLRRISSDAQAWCKRYGIEVGFLGPTRDSLDKLRRADLSSSPMESKGLREGLAALSGSHCVILAFALAAVSATVQALTGGGFSGGFTYAAWLGAWSQGPVTGLVLGGIRRLFGRTSIPRWMLWTTVAMFAIYVLGRVVAFAVTHFRG